MLTVVNKIKKGKTIFLSNNIELIDIVLYYSTFYIAGRSNARVRLSERLNSNYCANIKF